MYCFVRAAILVLVAAAPLSGQAPENTNENAKKKDPFKPFAEVIDGAVERTGFFDTYEKADNLYLAIPLERLNQDVLFNVQIARGIGARGLYGGTMLDIFEGKVVAFERHGNRVYLVQKPHRFPADPATPTGKAVNRTFGSSILESAKIETVREDSALVIDILGWVVSDLSGVSRRVRYAASSTPGKPGRASLDKSRSHLEWVKAFPHNVNIQAKLTFEPSDNVSISSVPDSRYIPVSVHYGLAQLPEQLMKPRAADDRVGFFMTVHKDFADDDKTFFKRYVNRWRLDCEDAPAGGLCEPKKPIVYYIDPSVPEEYRPALETGVESWAAAFEHAGFRNAIRAEMLPEDADPADIRYPTLRWNVSNEPGYGAVGPSIVDPRSGEILDADILFEANMVLGFKRGWRTLVSPATALEEMFNASEEEFDAMSQGAEMTTFGAELAAQGGLLRTVLAARGAIGPNEPVPIDFVNEALVWVTMHEVGHTLGMRHNFRASADTPLEKLHDRTWTTEHGVFSSVMEYPTTNISPDGLPNGHYYNPGVGSYDRWAIAFAYTPDPDRAMALAREAALPGHAYGTDEDARGAGALDPSVSVYDLSADPMEWGRQRANLIRGIWNDLPLHVLTDDGSYLDVTDAFQLLLGQYARAVATAVKYIGGQYQYRDHVGDPNERGPFVPVSREKQREALAFLTTHALSEDAFAIPQEVLQQFGADRWSHWGNRNTFQGRIDYPLHETVANLQRALLNQVTHPLVFSRIRDAEMKYGAANVLTIPELMQRLTEAVWSEVWSAPGRNIPSMRRDLQRGYLDRMIQFVTDAPDRTPADARSVARTQLIDLKRRLTRRLTPPYNFDAYTFAHLTETQAKVERALEAGLRIQN